MANSSIDRYQVEFSTTVPPCPATILIASVGKRGECHFVGRNVVQFGSQPGRQRHVAIVGARGHSWTLAQAMDVGRMR